MKFYKDGFYESFYWGKIKALRLDAVYNSSFIVWFSKNGKYHNNKNASYIGNSGYKEFHLNGINYSIQTKFTKETWRRFVKLRVFL